MSAVHNPISVEEINRCIRLFGDAQKSFMHAEKRAGLRSVLFDIPRRSSIGWHCIYEKGAEFLRELSNYASPEELGRRMQRLCSRPYYLTLSIVMCSYLGARQQIMLDRGLLPDSGFSEEKIEELGFIIDWWSRVCRVYRSDGLLLPEQANNTQGILPGATASAIDGQLLPMETETIHQLRRMMATLELYCFILHGEQRDGIFGHGLYPACDGSQLVILEFTDLQNDFLPWAETKVRNPYANVAVALRIKGAAAEFRLFGSILLNPPDIAESLQAGRLFTLTANDQILPIPFSEMPLIQRCAADAQNELYLKAAEWSPRFQAEYGVHLFANHLRSFFHLAGLGSSYDERIRQEFQSAAAPLIETLLSQKEPPSMWRFMATTEGDFFWPIVINQEVSTHNVHSQG